MSLKSFKIIYIAPLKALASEIVSKFQAALSYLKI
jgi:replicative superfamily II helicase